MKFIVVAVLCLVTLSFAGCLGSSSPNRNDRIASLEANIKNELHARFLNNVLGDATVSTVSCKSVNGGITDFDCLVAVTFKRSGSQSKPSTLDIIGTCGNDDCDWTTK